MSQMSKAPPSRFLVVLQSIRRAHTRPEVHLEEVPPPVRIAPFSAALNAEVRNPANPSQDLADGRIVVMHDPAGQETWQGDLRMVTMARAVVSPEFGGGAEAPRVVWDWLVEALSESRVDPIALAGTVTRTVSTPFGALEDRRPETVLELRASWTPRQPELSEHLWAWSNLLCRLAGLLPLPEGVRPLLPLR